MADVWATGALDIDKATEEKEEELKIFQKTQWIIDELRKNGSRVTNQRRILIDIILRNECSCNKEIYYLALQRDSSISMATVYRMIKTLEDLRAIDRKNMYRIVCEEEGSSSPDAMWMERVKKLLYSHRLLKDDEDVSIRVFPKGAKKVDCAGAWRGG